MEISQNFVAFLEYMNFTIEKSHLLEAYYLRNKTGKRPKEGEGINDVGIIPYSGISVEEL